MRVAPLRRLPRFDLPQLLRVSASLCSKLVVLDRVLRRLRDDAAVCVETAAPCTPCDLLEVSNGQHFGVLTVVLAELREEHRADRHVHADSQGVRPANDS